MSTKFNHDVVQEYHTCARDNISWLKRLVRLTVFGKSPTNAYLRVNKRVWTLLPTSFMNFGLIRSYGDLLHTLVRLQGVRGQLFHTFFLRNRPALELIRRIVERKSHTDILRVAVLGCSAGAEAYSIAWRIRSARPDLKFILDAVDISEQALEIARRGMYSLASSQFAGSDIFDGMTSAEVEELFDRNGDVLAVKSWIKEGINWRVGDVGQAEIVEALGPQDIVVANNFLCHMDAPVAERCLRNIARLVSPAGYLFVSGIDLDIRTRVAEDLGWHPLGELLEEIHKGDPRMGKYWPFEYASLEPLNKRRRNWRLRYAAVFQLALSGDRVRSPE